MDTNLKNCTTCKHQHGKSSVDDVPDQCYPCVWAERTLGYFPGWEEKWPTQEEECGWQGKTHTYAPMKTDNVNSPKHYTKAIEPIDDIMKNEMDFAEGSAIKYISRHKEKNGAEDIRKAIKFCEFILRYHYGEAI